MKRCISGNLTHFRTEDFLLGGGGGQRANKLQERRATKNFAPVDKILPFDLTFEEL